MKPSTTIIVVIAIAGAGAWWFLAPRASVPTQGTASGAGDVFKSPQDYKTSGGQQMKPRW